MTALSLFDAARLLREAKNPVVLIHTHPDGDCVGSAAALCHYFQGCGKPYSLLCQDPIPHRLAFLLEGLSPIPYGGEADRTVISVDVASRQKLGNLSDTFGEGKIHLMIDHHDRGTPFAPYLVMPEAAATGEILYYLFSLLEENGTPWTPALASCLYAAISSDTGCFRYSNCTPATHTAAAGLLEMGVKGGEINHRLFGIKSASQLRAEALTARGLKTYADGRVAYVSLPLALLRAENLTEEDIETAIDVARSLEGAEIAIVLKEITEGTWRVSLRSLGQDVASVATAFGGGGHIRAAGCTLENLTQEAAEAAVLEAVEKIL